MDIVPETVQFLHHKIYPHIPVRHKGLFAFGVQAFTLQGFTSLKANARTVIGNRSTAESKMYRLVTKAAVPMHFANLVLKLELVKPTDVINVDFSTFCGFQVLTFAKQTHLGRALPVYFAFITYPIEDEGSQTTFTMETIATFAKLLGFCPHLVFDRGFESPFLVPWLIEQQIPFTLRMRKDKYVTWLGNDLPLRNLPWHANDCLVTVYEHELRIVVSDKKKGMEEPWYILTNDTTVTRDHVISRYYFRFEIEETFKDLKHINQLKRFFPLRKHLTFTILLWFCMLTLWLSFLVAAMQTYLVDRLAEHAKERRCVTRYFFEQIQLAKTILFKENFAM